MWVLGKYIKGLFIYNFNVEPITWVCSIAWAALEREVCARSLITTPKVPRRKSEVIAAREMQADEACAQS